MAEPIICPFCGEGEDRLFDLMGLKHHLLSRWCEPFNELSWEEINHERTEKQ